jgi:hypothetical protein
MSWLNGSTQNGGSLLHDRTSSWSEHERAVPCARRIHVGTPEPLKREQCGLVKPTDLIASSFKNPASPPPGCLRITTRPAAAVPLHVLYVGKPDAGGALARIVEMELAARQIDDVAVEVLGDRGAVRL